MKMLTLFRRAGLIVCGIAALPGLVALVGCSRGLQKTTSLPGWTQSNPGAFPTDAVPYSPSYHEGVGRAQQHLLPGRFRSGSVVRDEEVWFISRGPVSEESDDTPGSGIMASRPAHGKKLVPLPLKHTDVQARVEGYIASVDVTQQFHNPYDAKIEAVYIFPLPHDSAVSEFLMIIGERRIRGIIRERPEAEKRYANAKSHGYVASLLTQGRRNNFIQ